MKRYLLATILLGLAAVLLAPALVVPRGVQRAVVLKSDGHIDAAHRLTEQLYRHEAPSERIVYELAQLKFDLGKVEDAGNILAKFSSEQPELLWPQEELLKMRNSFGTEKAFIQANFDVYKTDPGHNSGASYRILVDHYRITGNHQRESEILERAISEGRAPISDIARLGMIKASTNQIPDAIRILRAVEDRLPMEAVRPRLTLYALLISNGQPLNAIRYAAQLKARWPGSRLADELAQIDIALGFQGFEPVRGTTTEDHDR